MASDLLGTITEMLPPEMQAQLKDEQFRTEIRKTLAQFQMQDDAINGTGELMFAPDMQVADIGATDEYVTQNTAAQKSKREREKAQQEADAKAGARSAQSEAESLTAGSAQKRGMKGMRSGFSRLK